MKEKQLFSPVLMASCQRRLKRLILLVLNKKSGLTMDHIAFYQEIPHRHLKMCEENEMTSIGKTSVLSLQFKTHALISYPGSELGFSEEM